jgi:hypothetical protein
MAHASTVLDAERETDHIGIGEKRQRRPQQHGASGRTLKRRRVSIHARRGHTDRYMTKARHSIRDKELFATAWSLAPGM